MIKKILYFFAVFVLIFFIGFFAVDLVSAQSVGIRISPTIIDEIVDPGEIFNDVVKVANESDTPKVMYVYLRDFKADGESGKPKIFAPGMEKGYYLASWIEITDEAIEFNPYEEKIIPFTVRVPADIGPGGYYGAVYFGTVPPRLQLDSEEKGAGMSIAQQNGTLILLKVSGDVNEEAQVREFNTDKNFYNTPYQVNFLIRIENKGNVHVKPFGTISINNMFGKEVAKIVVNEEGGNILPDSIRRFETAWEGKNGFGRYEANLGLTYGVAVDKGGQGNQTLFSPKYFWIIPWRIIIPSLLGVVIIAAFFMLMLKLYKNKAVKSAMEQAGMRNVRYVKKYQGPSPVFHFSMILLITLIVLFLIIAGIYFIFFA